MALDIKHTKTYTPFDPKDYISYVGRELTEASTLEANASLDVLPNFVESNVQGYYEIDLAKPDSYVLFPGQRTAIYNLNSINKIRDSAFNYFVVTREIEQLPVEDIPTLISDRIINIIPNVTLVSDIGYANATNSNTKDDNFRKYSYYAIQITDINRPIDLYVIPKHPLINMYVKVFDDLIEVDDFLTNTDVEKANYGGGGKEGDYLEERDFIRKATGTAFDSLYKFRVSNNQFIVFAVDSDSTNDIPASPAYIVNDTYLVDNGITFSERTRNLITGDLLLLSGDPSPDDIIIAESKIDEFNTAFYYKK